MTRQRTGMLALLLCMGILAFGITGCKKETENTTPSTENNQNDSTATTNSGQPSPDENTEPVKPAPDENTIAEGHAFPALNFSSVSGEEVDLASLKGKVVLVDFWAAWCPPCVAAMPDLIKTYEEFHDQGFEIVGISLDQDKSKFETYIKENGITWEQYYDGLGWDNKLAKRFGVRGIPHIVLIDKRGAIHFNTNYNAGKDPLHGDALKNAIKSLL